MPIVQGNEPRQPQRSAGGSVVGWIIPLAFLGPMLYRLLRNATAGLLTDQQLVIAVGGVVAFGVMVWVLRRVNGLRASSTTHLPAAYELSKPDLSRQPAMDPVRRDGSYVPQPPRYEPILTGKVVLAGVVLATLMGGFWLLLFVL